MITPYKNLSAFYEKIIYDDYYVNLLQGFLGAIAKTLPFGNCLDVGAGTGIFTRMLKRKGYQVVGVDLSRDMLSVAEEISRREKLAIKYIQGDVRSLKTLEKVDLITMVNDVVNYLPKKDLQKAFLSLSKALKKGGVLAFDYSTEYKLKNVLAGNMYGDDGDELSYVWLNEYDDTNEKVDMSLSFFVKDGDTYKRFNEDQSQYAHKTSEIKTVLENCGFEIKLFVDENFNNVTETTQRVFVIAIKR